MKAVYKHRYERVRYVYQSNFESGGDYTDEIRGGRNNAKEVLKESIQRHIDACEDDNREYTYLPHNYRAIINRIHNGTDKCLYIIKQIHRPPQEDIPNTNTNTKERQSVIEYQKAIIDFCKMYNIDHSVAEGYAIDYSPSEQHLADSVFNAVKGYREEFINNSNIDNITKNDIVYRYGKLIRTNNVYPSELKSVNNKGFKLMDEGKMDTPEFEANQELRDRIAFDEALKVVDTHKKAALVFGARHNFRNELDACLATDKDLPTIYEVMLEPYDSKNISSFKTSKEQNKTIWSKLMGLWGR